jgi:hypothetical protein
MVQHEPNPATIYFGKQFYPNVATPVCVYHATATTSGAEVVGKGWMSLQSLKC